MRFKATLLAVCCFVFLFSACQPQSSTGETCIYKSPNVQVSLIDDSAETVYAHYEWAALTKDIAHSKNSVILTGTISNIRQASVSYRYMDTDITDNITIFDVKVSDTLACRSDSFVDSGVVTVGVGYNMLMYTEEFPKLADGAEYMMFCYLPAEQEDDVLELAQYVDCWISNPRNLLCEKVGNCYLTSDFFSDAQGCINLANDTDLTEKKANLFPSDVSVELLADNIGEDSPNAADASAALATLMSRIGKNSGTLWSLSEQSYVVGCDALENHVQDAFAQYNG